MKKMSSGEDKKIKMLCREILGRSERTPAVQVGLSEEVKAEFRP